LIRYIENRPGQFDYQNAIKNNLPIGSGQIESAHRTPQLKNRLGNIGL